MLDRFRQRSDPIAVEAAASALEIANAQTLISRDNPKLYPLDHPCTVVDPDNQKASDRHDKRQGHPDMPDQLVARGALAQSQDDTADQKSAQRDRKMDCDDHAHGMRTSASTSADT